MRKSILGILLLIACSSYGQQSDDRDVFKKYSHIIESGTLQQKDSLATVFYNKTSDYNSEGEFQTAINILNVLGNEDKAKEVSSLAKAKYPNGSITRNSYLNEVFYEIEDLKEKEKAYKELLRKWPIEKFPGEELTYDMAAGSLARDFASEVEVEKSLKYLESMKERFWRGNAYLPVGNILLNAGDTSTALPLIETIMEDTYYYLTLPEEEQSNKSKFASLGYAPAMSSYVKIMMNQGRYEEAISNIEKALKVVPEQADALDEVYYKALLKENRKLEAYNILRKIYVKGNFKVEEDLKQAYGDLNGSLTGYDNFLANLGMEVRKNIRNHIKEFEVFKAAPSFELLDLNGELVSLEDLRGKVLVLDFWATWCQPCIRSFPGMSAAQKMYENDEDVKFLFINTWERDEDYKNKVSSFLTKNNYQFDVLFDDQKDPETGELLAAKFGVQGIPAKFIIDKEGNIRYFLTGSSPNEDYIKLEMRELIESTKKVVKVSDIVGDN